MSRCPWAGNSAIYTAYHDDEWGVPLHDDQQLFELLCLEGQQAGLSWLTVLQKREHYRQLFHGFDPERVAAMTDAEIEQLLMNANLIRNRLKLFSIRNNAQVFLTVKQEFGSFDRYIWRFVDNEPIINNWSDMASVPSSTDISLAMSKDLKKRGFKFIGSTICYAFMQASGLINDHLISCDQHSRGKQTKGL